MPELKQLIFFHTDAPEMVYIKIKATYPFSQVVGQDEISGEGV